jgi:N-glycosylase/DNA lyase
MRTEGKEKLALLIKNMKADPKLRKEVGNRISEFKEIHSKNSQDWFRELVYCILTAYSSAQMGEKCVEKLTSEGFLYEGNVEEITFFLKIQGHRFAFKRADYILNARKYQDNLKKIIQSQSSVYEAREWLVKHIKGFGMKEASHFLRNVGYLNLAIIDRHILSNMMDVDLIDPSHRSLTRRRYLEYEKILSEVAKIVNMELGEMDLYLWYKKTGKVMK